MVSLLWQSKLRKLKRMKLDKFVFYFISRTCEIIFNGNVISRSTEKSRKLSTTLASQKAFELLKKDYYQILINDPSIHSVAEFLNTIEETWHPDGDKAKSEKVTIEKFQEDRRPTSTAHESSANQVNTSAMKMMKAMGWKEGSGLGAQKQGIVEPIK